MRPNKLKAHFENAHPTFLGKNIRVFLWTGTFLKSARLDNTGLFQLQNEAILIASYEVSQLIARTKKTHTIGESLIAPSGEIIVRLLQFNLMNRQMSHYCSN